MGSMGEAHVGVGMAKGKGKVLAATRNALSQLSNQDLALSRVEGALCYFHTDECIGIAELSQAA